MNILVPINLGGGDRVQDRTLRPNLPLFNGRPGAPALSVLGSSDNVRYDTCSEKMHAQEAIIEHVERIRIFLQVK